MCELTVVLSKVYLPRKKILSALSTALECQLSKDMDYVCCVMTDYLGLSMEPVHAVTFSGRIRSH